MKNYFALCLPLVAVLTACEPRDDYSENDRDNDVTGYALRATDYSWPSLAQAQPLSASLLTANYYLVIDGSGSMDDQGCSGERRKIDVAKDAVNQFIDAIPADANIGLLVFDHNGISERVALGHDPVAVKEQVNAIDVGGGTPLRSSMAMAFEAITTQAQQQLGYGEYHMVVVTDGEANSGQDPGDVVQQMLTGSPVVIHTIGFCIGDGHSLNVPGVTDYRAANNPQELLGGLRSVLAEAPNYVADEFEADKAP